MPNKVGLQIHAERLLCLALHDHLQGLPPAMVQAVHRVADVQLVRWRLRRWLSKCSPSLARSFA
jgi:hypothetical protein